MNRLIFLFFSTYIIINISSFEICNIYSSYINPKICNSLVPNDIKCYYEINIWYYVPDNINKIYFCIYPEVISLGIKFYLGYLNNNDFSKIKRIETNRNKIYEISKEKDKLYVIFSEEYIENKKINIYYYDSDNQITSINPKILQLSYYKNYPIEFEGEPDSEAMVSFYDYDKDPNKIYLISNNKYFIYYINTNSSSINYNIFLNFFDIYDSLKKNEYKLYRNINNYYLISKRIFIKIERSEDFLLFTDISSANENFNKTIKNNQNIYNLEQVEYSSGEILHIYFLYNEHQVCSMEYDCVTLNLEIIKYITFYYDGGCFILINRKTIYSCSFNKNNNNKMEIEIGSEINNSNLPSGDKIDQIRVFPLDEKHSNFLLCSLHSSTKKVLYCLIFNINSIQKDLNNKTPIKIFNDIDDSDIISINIFPYRSNRVMGDNLFIIVYKNEYNIIDIDNNISITGNQLFINNELINRDTSIYDLGNNKYFLTYSTGEDNINIGINMGSIPKSRKILKIIENYQQYLEISFNELYNVNEKLSNESYKVIFIKPVFYNNEDNSLFNNNDIDFFYIDNSKELKFYDSIQPEYEIKLSENESQKIIIKLSNTSFNIVLNYTIFGEQLASKNHIKIMNLPKCNKFCSTCNYEIVYLSNLTNHLCEICDNNYEYFLKIEYDGKMYNNCYASCPSEHLFYIEGEKECYEQCPFNSQYYIQEIYKCFEECPEGYYQYENSFECNNKCPEGYFMDPKNKKCARICPEGLYGDDNTKKCEVNCSNNFYKNDINHLCVKNCPDGLLSDNKNKKCVNECPRNLYENTINNSCNENCPENYYKSKLLNRCVEDCPEGYYKDNDNYFCLKDCKEGYIRDFLTDICISENPENNIVYLDINDKNECTKLILENYLYLIAPNKLYECKNLKIEIFSGEDDQNQISTKNNMIYLDINDCLNYIIENSNNITSRDQLIIIIIENPSQYPLLENFNFYVYDLNNNQIDLQICKENNIQTKISKDIYLDNSDINEIKYYKEKYSIDITNSNENWLNNICISFQNKEGLDMSMEYRHSKIFKNICGENAKYDIIYEQSKINCFISDYNYEETNDNFLNYLGESNINIIKCYNLAFDYSKAIKNKANWVILSLFLVKSLFLVVYLFSLMTSIETFLGYWKIFKDIKENNIINSNNNLFQTIKTEENNDITTKIKFNFKNYKIKEIKSDEKNKAKVIESLSTVVQSKTLKNQRKISEKESSAPPKKSNKKREEKEFVFQKTEKIVYTRYIDKDDDIISEGCFPIMLIDAKKALKKEEEERKKKEEEERKRIEEEERERLEEEKIRKEEEKKRMEEEEIKKGEEEMKRKEEKKKMEEEEKRRIREERKKKREEVEEKKKKEKENEKKEIERIKNEKEDKKKKIEEERQRRIQEMKKRREEDNEKWMKLFEKREIMEDIKKRKNKEILKQKMKGIYERRNYGFEEENNVEFLKKMEEFEKLREKEKNIRKKTKNNTHLNEKEESGVYNNNRNDENYDFEIENFDNSNEEENSKEEEKYNNNIDNKEENKSNENEDNDKSDSKQENKKNEKKEKIEQDNLEEDKNNNEEENSEKENSEKEKSKKEKSEEENSEEENSAKGNSEVENSEEENIEEENIVEKKSKNSKKEEEDLENYLNKSNEINNINNDELEIQNKYEDQNEIKEIEEEEEKNNNSEKKENEDKKEREDKTINNKIEEEDNISEQIKNNNFILNDYFNNEMRNNEQIKLEDKKNNDEKSNSKENDIKIMIKDFSDIDNEIANNRYLAEKENIKASKRMFLEDEENLSVQTEKDKNNDKKSQFDIFQKPNDKFYQFYVKYKEYKASDYRINNLPFDEALKYDDRKYYQIYKFYIINSEIILNLIFSQNYLELFSLKVIFLMSITGIEGLFNSLLYENKYVNNIYDNNGKYNFFYNFPKSLLSDILTYLIDILLFQLINSKNKFQEIMEDTKIKNYEKEFESIIKCLKRKIIIFLIIDFIITGFAWYYCSIFCAIYPNNCKYWLISSAISLAIHFLLPFVLCLIPTFFKYYSFKKKNQKLYKLNRYMEVLFI